MKSILKFQILLTILFSLLTSNGVLYGQEIAADSLSKEPDVRVALKASVLCLIGVVNPAVEVRLHENISFQLEGFGVFYPREFLGSGYPFSLGSAFGEFRYYPKEVYKGFFVGGHAGYGVYRLNKNLNPFKWGRELNYSKNPKTIFVGQNMMTGLTLGYVFTFKRNDHWGIEISWGLGWQGSKYESYTPNDSGTWNNLALNSSTEWMPAYKGGLFVVYRW